MLHRRHPRHAPTTLDTRNVRLGACASITAVLLSALALTRTERGLALLGRVVSFLEFYAGVFALVLLTTTVALGLLTTERAFLTPAWRVRAQLAHRATAVIGMAYLVTHILLMVGLGHVPVGAVIVPVAGAYVFIGVLGLGLMAVALVTGVIRGRFAVRAKPWTWRVLHSAAYAAWPLVVAHGLTAGRPPDGWVAWSYVACLAAVASALLVRVVATLRRPSAMPERVPAPAVTAPAAEPRERVGAPVSLADARRRFREAG